MGSSINAILRASMRGTKQLNRPRSSLLILIDAAGELFQVQDSGTSVCRDAKLPSGEKLGSAQMHYRMSLTEQLLRYS
jgi:hypothetical protein